MKKMDLFLILYLQVHGGVAQKAVFPPAMKTIEKFNFSIVIL